MEDFAPAKLEITTEKNRHEWQRCYQSFQNTVPDTPPNKRCGTAAKVQLRQCDKASRANYYTRRLTHYRDTDGCLVLTTLIPSARQFLLSTLTTNETGQGV